MSKPSKPYTNAVINVGNVLRRFPDTGTVDELRLAIRTAVNVALDPDHQDEQRPIPGERPGPFLPPIAVTRGGIRYPEPDFKTRVFHHWKAQMREGREVAYCHDCEKPLTTNLVSAGRCQNIGRQGQQCLREAENRCLNCRRTIRIMINRGMGWCSEDCRKQLAAGWEAEAAVGAEHALAVLDGLRAAVPDRYTERGWLAQLDDLRTADERHADE